MIEIIDFGQAMGKLVPETGRTPTSPEASDSFANLAAINQGGVFIASFDGTSPWERHLNGDELVQIIKGAVRLTILGDDVGEEVLDLTGGSMLVIPKGRWHNFDAPDGVTVMTVTPLPTDHSSADDPRA